MRPVSPVCTKCGAGKSSVGFYADHRRTDGLKAWCKQCCAAYRKTPAGMTAEAAYEKSALGKMRIRRSATTHGVRNPLQMIARNAVNHAIEAGRERPKPQRIGPFNQPAVMDGIAIRAGGETLETANVLIQLDDGQVVSGEVSKELAQEIGRYLYRVPLRFQGDARWQRAESGDWELLRLKIRSFQPLNNDTLSDALERIRAIGESDWEKADDPLKLLREDRADQSKS